MAQCWDEAMPQVKADDDLAGRPARRATGKRDLTQGPITRTLLIFSLPIMGGNALQSLNGSVNQFWVSHSLGVTAITAIGNANVIMMLMVGTIFGISMAANILIGQSVGARDMAAVKRVMTAASCSVRAVSRQTMEARYVA